MEKPVEMQQPKVTNFYTVFYAAVYMACSIGIIFTNKLVLTTYRFPSFMLLASAQSIFTFCLIGIVFPGSLKRRSQPEVLKTVFPLSVCYAIDVTMGIAGTGSLSLPMFSAFRRASNFLIMIGEYYFLGTKRSCSVYTSVFIMVFGAGVAAMGDLSFDVVGYTYVFINNFSTAGKALLTKSRLRDSGYSSLELLYYNSGYMIPFLLIILCFCTNFDAVINFPSWWDPLFIFYFLFSCCSAVLLNYALFQCTHYTSVLTTSIIGVIKNIVTTYAGMFVGGDYIYTPLNFSGVTISAFGAILYVFLVYMQNKSNATMVKKSESASVGATKE